MQKIKLIPRFLLQILQRFCKVFFLGTLGMPVFGYQKRRIQLVENLYVYLKAKKSNLPLTSFFEIMLRYCKLAVWVLWACIATSSKTIVPIYKGNVDAYLQAKNQLDPKLFS